MTKVYVAGHQGMVGSALVRCLANDEDIELITATKKELDLLDAKAVKSFLGDRRPDVVYLAAARVGGILANDTKPADFLYENLTIQNNVIHSSFSSGIERLLFLGSSCIYPRITSQPIREEQLLDGQLEGTNEGYAIAKIAGIKL
jgi:GDP-L-fucose synthase